MKYIFTLILLALLSSCGSSINTRNMSAENLYNKGIELKEEEDYLESQKMFDLIKLQYPASQFADDAQFYLAELDFLRGKYILAAFNYNSLRRVYPSSQYNKEALYKKALCYYKLSPPYERDQQYTHKAISSLLEFQGTYPGDSLAKDADTKILEMRSKLAHRKFSTAELYKKLDDPKAAIVYYDIVINQYDDTIYYEESYWGKVQSLHKMGRIDEANTIIQLYNREFPEGQYSDSMIELMAQK